MHVPNEEQVHDLLTRIGKESPDGRHELPKWFNQIMFTTGTNLGLAVIAGKMQIGTALITAMKVAFKIALRAKERGWIVDVKDSNEAARTNKAKDRVVATTEE